MGYKPMATAQTVRDQSLSIQQAVSAAVASHRDDLRHILGSEPIVEWHDEKFVLATYGAGRYVELSSFSLEEMPGCCGVLVFYHASIAEDFIGKGLGSLLLTIREEAARKANYTVAMCSVLKFNKKEIAILEKANWKVDQEFQNKRTKNTVLIMTKRLD